ncbi:hypothetical protein Pst134EA_017694 [Puccinia striiformis f. sp. tritici]|uniref:hypothetical protein n=1 Tax=Puccinia striiformis f. sp. tritici TaxID=168172 RepID=UPI00200881AC|nr:hypothetical protein Pst134EA_017694 [Puccinia striiformis f. sp. tritici]KAH9461388.1 hypothetical protein Pst134EA_017694 [Puccinia striiformis f. sp. tritici]
MQLSQEAEDEIALLQSMYQDQFQWIDRQSAAYQLTLQLPFADRREYQVQIKITISPEYPSLKKPEIRIRIPDPKISREDEVRFIGTFTECNYSDKEESQVCVDIIVDKLTDLAASFNPACSCAPSIPDITPPSSSSTSDQAVDRMMAWSVFWMHHIKATSKRKNIVEWARELEIRGWSKPGYPGVVIIDGSKESIDEYCKRMKGLKWKAIQQRHYQVYHIPHTGVQPSSKEEQEGDGYRRIKDHYNHTQEGMNPDLHRNLGVVEVQSMATLFELVRRSGFHDQIAQILKIK